MINDNNLLTKIDALEARLIAQNLPRETLIRWLAERHVWAESLMQQIDEGNAKREAMLSKMECAFNAFARGELDFNEQVKAGNALAMALSEIITVARKRQATKASNSLHSQPGGSRDKQDKIRELWATGKYKSRTDCALKECSQIGMSYDAARKALRNVPTPS